MIAPGFHYNTAAPFTARKAFVFGGVEYRPGDVFPWREVGATERDLWRLWQVMLVRQSPPRSKPDALGGFEALARIGAACARSLDAATSSHPSKPKRARAGA